MTDIHADRILILDFGSQYTQLIARRLREIGVYCEIWAWDAPPDLMRAFAPSGIVLSGGPESTIDAGSPRAPDVVFELEVPILGICYGMQTMAAQLGGRVAAGAEREFGYARIELTASSTLLDGLGDPAPMRLGEGESWMGHDAADEGPQGPRHLDVWMSHGDRVEQVPPGFSVIARSDTVPIVAMGDAARRWYGLQFHPEVTHTRDGDTLLRRFLIDCCGCATRWNAEAIIDDAVARVRAQVGDAQVLLGLSGGVDSSVVAALLHRAIGAQLVCVFVDTGLLRWGEGDQVMDTFARNMGVRVIRVDAGERYFAALRGVADPEAKRKQIGGLFVEIFEEQAQRLDGIGFLAQGTIYPDVIESAGSKTGKAHVIKSHHNVGGLPANMRMQLVEPLRELFKDEVRRIGLELGLPSEMVQRHPFPGPGLGVRVLGEVAPEAVAVLQRADHIFIEELRAHSLYERVSQAFAVYLPVRSVGVVGDARAYEPVIALRAVETIDFMTARWAELPYAFLDHVARRIVNEVRGVSRVVYDISGKPPATIEWE